MSIIDCYNDTRMFKTHFIIIISLLRLKCYLYFNYFLKLLLFWVCA